MIKDPWKQGSFFIAKAYRDTAAVFSVPLVSFRPASGSNGPAAGAGIIAGKFFIPAENGPTVGPHEVVVKIVGIAANSMKSDESTLLKHGIGDLKSFSQRVEITTGVNELELSFPSGSSSLGNSRQ